VRALIIEKRVQNLTRLTTCSSYSAVPHWVPFRSRSRQAAGRRDTGASAVFECGRVSILLCPLAASSSSESDRLKIEDSEDRLPQTIHQFGSQRSTEVTRGAYESPECPLQLTGS